MTNKKLIIAIDGHSSCGQSTFAKAIARSLGYTWIDSGAMYRAVTLYCMRKGILKDGTLDDKKLNLLLDNIDISFRGNPGSATADTCLNGENVEEQIRNIDVASNVSIVSSSAPVREKMVALQREMGRNKGIVMDGRDIGTVVFPDADIKIFLTADAGIRAQRRYRELAGKGRQVSLEEIRDNIIERDRLDETRSESPLRKAPDALVLDNSHMTPEEQMEWFSGLLKNKDHEGND